MSTGLDARTFRILLVEDNAADVYLFRQALKSAGLNFELTVIEDGADGLAFARRQGKYAANCVPDLTVLDLNLPKSGGASVLEAIRRNKDLETCAGAHNDLNGRTEGAGKGVRIRCGAIHLKAAGAHFGVRMP